jgi:hypothetical protein
MALLLIACRGLSKSGFEFSHSRSFAVLIGIAAVSLTLNAVLAVSLARKGARPSALPHLMLSILLGGLTLSAFQLPVFHEATVRSRTSKAEENVQNALHKYQDARYTLPADPFRNRGPIETDRQPNGFFKAWSIGPDQKDQHGRIRYDATNGIISAGDIVAHN